MMNSDAVSGFDVAFGVRRPGAAL